MLAPVPEQTDPHAILGTSPFEGSLEEVLAADGAALGADDGLFAVPVTGPHRGHVEQFLTVPKGAETCGPVITDDRILIAAQHPGETDGATTENPGSAWPDRPGTVPRPSVVAVWES